MKPYSFMLSLPSVAYIIAWFYYLFTTIFPFIQTNILDLAQVQLNVIVGTALMLSAGIIVLVFSIMWIFVCWTE